MNKKVLVLSTGDVNGAYEAMYKLSQVLQNIGCEVVMCVKHKSKNDTFIKVYSPFNVNEGVISKFFRRIKKYSNKLYSYVNRKELYTEGKYAFFSKDESSININPKSLINSIGFVPDVIFTGMTIDFINSTDLLNIYKYTGAKIYNITVDMNHFTGGCHFAWECDGYITGCTSQCPALVKSINKDLAKENFETKMHNVKAAKMEILAGSGLTLEQAKKSKIYKNQKVIYNLNSNIDTKLLNTKNKDIAKRIFNLDEDKFYILTGAQNLTDPRKGFEFLIKALQLLSLKLDAKVKSRIVILVVSNKVSEEFENLDFEKQLISYIKDYRLLSLLYQAVDLYVNTSIEDSGPMMVSEALACGTPVVGFDTGILINMVVDNYNGFKYPLRDYKGLAKGIENIINLTKDEYKFFSKNAVAQVEEYSSYEYTEDVLRKILESQLNN